MKKGRSRKFAIEFSRVSVNRGTNDVLRNIDLRISPGESVAILGPNGSGKSTLVKTIARELYPTKGVLRLFGEELWDVFELRSRLGLVSNDLQATFMRAMTGEEAVISGFFSSVGLWTNHHVTPLMRKKAKRVIAKLGLSHLDKRPMDHLSSGESRRFLIARALVHSPRTLVFDEPTNSLDLKAQRIFRNTISRLMRYGIGAVMATHQLSDLVPEMKRIVVLKEGEVVADGAKNEILTTKLMTRVFGVAVTIIQKEGVVHAY